MSNYNDAPSNTRYSREERSHQKSSRDRSRSYSPERLEKRHRDEHKPRGSRDDYTERRSDEKSKNQVPPPPQVTSKTASGLQIKIQKPKTPALTSIKPVKPLKSTVQSAFNLDSDDEVEEMPDECRRRMRNIGRDTPTSSGPNSFGKTKQGFCDFKKIFEKQQKAMVAEDDDS